MKPKEFEKICPPYNIAYRDIFGYIPTQREYVCDQEEYIEALKKAIANKVELDHILKRRADDAINNPLKMH